MKILITGSEGFIGKALSTTLLEAGHTVTGFDLQDGDISARGTLEGTGTADHVFHLAARSYVPDSWENPFEFYHTNLDGTVNVLEFCRKTGAALTYISSYLYGAPQYLPVDENHPVQPYNPYSHSKIIAEDTCRFYRDHFGIKVTILRPFNIYGPGQDAKFVIPHILNQLLDTDKETIEVMDIRPKRDYLFISDFIRALQMTIRTPGSIYNIGSGRSVSVEEIIRTASKVSGITKPVVTANKQRPNEIMDLYADISRAEKELGWSPEIDICKGIEKILKKHTEFTDFTD